MASQRKYRTYELQKRLPRLPVPELDRTIAKYLKSVEPLLTAEDLEKSRKVAEDFIKPGGVGRELQRFASQSTQKSTLISH